MNKDFNEFVRQGSFTLTLSERMIKILFHLDNKGPDDDRLHIAPYQALNRRGLASFENGKGFTITKEGKLTVELLELAGFNTITGTSCTNNDKQI